MKINVGRGFKRAAYFLLGFIWLVVFGFLIGTGASAFDVGQAIAYTLFFSFGYLLFCAAVAWVYRGFTKDS